MEVCGEKIKTRALALIFLLAALLCAMPSGALAAGTQPGIADGVWQIGTKDNLVWFAEKVGGGETDIKGKLTADVDLGGASWTPIGTSANKFTGIFDGNGRKISNLSIASGVMLVDQGLFGYVGPAGIVGNVTLDGLNINLTANNSNRVGGIAANNEGRIINCRVNGVIKAFQRVGGIVGSNKAGGEIIRCANGASVSGSAYVGGVAGEFAGTMSLCSNTGAVVASSAGIAYAGGLAGSKITTGATSIAIEKSFNAGAVAAESASSGSVGGLLGAAASGSPTLTMTMADSFNYGQVRAKPGASAASRGAIAAGTLGAGTNAPALEGIYYLDGVCDKGAFNSGTSANVIAKSADDFRAATVIADFGFDGGEWELLPGGDYPTLKRVDAVDLWNQTPDTPDPLGDYEISTKADLFNAADEINDDVSVNGRSYEGTITIRADIDLGGENWTPIAEFAGTLDGGGHKISGLRIIDSRESSHYNVGLFGKLLDGAVVKDLIIEDAEIDAERGIQVGAVAGVNSGGSIERCFVSGNITARSSVGGLVGAHESGAILLCGSDVSVESLTESFNQSWAGGVAGRVGGVNTGYDGTAQVENVYSLGKISGRGSYVGGLFGQINAGASGTVTARNGYSLCDVTPTEAGTYYAPISGGSVNATIEKMYFSGVAGARGVYQVNNGDGIVPDTFTTPKTVTDFAVAGASGSVLTLLNEGSGAWKQGAFSPILTFQADQSTAQYTVAVSASGSGAAQLSGGGSVGSFPVATLVTVEAEAGDDASFLGWYEDEDGPSVSKNTIYSFTLSRNITLIAKFGEPSPAASWYDPNLASYKLANGDQLIYFAELVGDGVDFRGKTVTLDFDRGGADHHAEIDETFYLSGDEWGGIGSESKPFAGIFNGAGHKIAFESPAMAGLFNALAADGKVLAVKVSGVITTGGGHIGGVVSVNRGYVEACRFSGALTRYTAGHDDAGYAGGVVGYNFGGTVKNCVNDGDVSFDENDGENTSVGGVVGYSVGNSASVAYNINNGQVRGGSAVGGIVGKLMSSEGTGAGVTRSENTGAVIGKSDAGGIVGLAFDSLISESVNSGMVAGAGGGVASRFGGIVGYNKAGDVVKSSNSGAVAADGADEVGGVAGLNDGLIDHCFNTGAVSGRREVGGVAGRNLTGVLVTYVYNTGVVDGEKYVGGIAGYNEDVIEVSNGYSTGRVMGDSPVGGLFGADTNFYADDWGLYKDSVYSNLYYSIDNYSGMAYETEIIGHADENHPANGKNTTVDNVAGLSGDAFENGQAVSMLNSNDTNNVMAWMSNGTRPVFATQENAGPDNPGPDNPGGGKPGVPGPDPEDPDDGGPASGEDGAKPDAPSLGSLDGVTLDNAPASDSVCLASDARGIDAGGKSMRDALEERGLGGMASYVTRGDAGLVVADAEQVVKGLSDEDKARLNLDAIIPLPVFTTDLPGGKTVAAVTFACGSLAEFSGNTVGDMEVLKIVVSGDTIPLARAESLREIIASQFVITDGEGGSISPDTMLGEAELFITVAIEDNGALDWDVAPGRIADPLALALKAAEEGASHGGGCGVGFGAISLLAALALRVRKRA